MKQVWLFWVIFLLLGENITAQVLGVSGTVISEEDNLPVIGASVLVKGTNLGAITDIEGKFNILNVPSSAKSLVVSYVGMTSQEVKISSKPVVVYLKSDSKLLDEVVITGYGVTRKAAFTGSAQVVESNDLRKRSDDNFLKSLEGSVAGFQMMNASGQPGAYASTTIRGTSSLNSGTEPLYVIDGVPMYTSNVLSYGESESSALGVNPLANINAADIESVTVLKDATATSIYGARAANGVIVITTKRGKSGKAKVNLSMKYGRTFLGQMDDDYRMLGLAEYKEIWTEGIQNGFKAGNISESVLSDMGMTGVDLSIPENAAEFGRRWGIKYYNSDWDTCEDIDWFDQAIKNSSVQQYDLSVQGGNDNLAYFASLGYYQNGGIVIGSGMKRYSGRLNLDAKSGIFKFGASINISLSDVDQIPISSSYNNPMVLAYDTRPIQQIYNEDGSYAMVQDGDYNLVALYDKNTGDIHNQKTLITILNPYFSIDLMKGLVWKTNAGLTINQVNLFDFQGKNNPSTYASGEYSTMVGSKSRYNTNTYSLTNTLNYITSFNNRHNLNIMLGQEIQKLTIDKLAASAKGYPYSDMKELINAATPSRATSLYAASTLASFFSNFEYDYSDKYYLSASFRYDGSSRFGKDHRWAPFWSVGGKYRITQEEFMQSTSHWLSDLTIHASYGAVGNQDIGFYAAKGLYKYGSPYNSQAGSVPYQLENPDLKWETVNKFDIGFNAYLWNRLSLDIDYYNQYTKDMIFNVPMSRTSGFSYITKNIGAMRNTGIEAMIKAHIMDTHDFGWNVTFSYTYNKNKIVRMATDDPITTNYNIQKEGEAVNSFYLPEWAGVDPETGEGLWYTNGKGTPTTTDINEAHQVVLGQAAPKYYGALGMNFTYKGFDLDFSFNYSGGNKVFNRGFQYDMHAGSYLLGPVSKYVYENRWKEEGDIAKVPQFVWGGNKGAVQRTSRFLMDGDYVRLKNITLGYNFTKNLCSKIHMDNLRIYVSADNLFTLTKDDFIGFDPQAGATGFVQWAYPVATTIMFGINIGL